MFRALGAGAIALISTSSLEARADCPRPERPWVSIEFGAGDWSADFRDDVLAHLRAGLAHEAFDLCARTDDAATAALAAVRLAAGSGSVRVTIDVRDGVTRKRVVRSLNLAGLPEDGRALAVAVAADELLRASWAEVALHERAERRAPEAVRRTVRASLRPGFGPRATELMPRFSVEHYDGGQTLLGGDAHVRHWFGARVGVAAAIGLRSSPAVASEHGDIEGTGLHGTVTVGVRILRNDTFAAGPEAGLATTLLAFRGQPREGANGSSESSAAVYARGGLSGQAFVGSLLLEARAGAGAPLRAVAVADDGVVRTGVSGVELYGSLGAGVAF